MTHFLYRSQDSAKWIYKGLPRVQEMVGILVSAKARPKTSVQFAEHSCRLRRSRSQPPPGSTGNLTGKIAVTAYLASSDGSSRVNVSRIMRLPLSMASNTIDSFDPFNIFELIDFLLTPCFSITYVCHDVWHGSCLGERCDVRINCEAVMWKITTRGFTLEEVLIMAAMNLLASTATALQHENELSQESIGDQAWN